MIAFAGAVGSSKSPISFYLSARFGLPIYNTDVIRTEVIEDLNVLNEEEFTKRRDARLKDVLELGNSFILDASLDRLFGSYKEAFMESGYDHFIISMDLSGDLLAKLYRAKGYTESLNRLDQLLADHDNFLKEHGEIVDLHITDSEFNDRLKISEEAFSKWLDKK
jgi:hypothetical protein